MSDSLTPSSLREAVGWLAAIDADLGAIVDRLGVPPMWAREPGFATLVQIILEQQVSLAAAQTLYRRVSRELGGMTPEAVLKAGPVGLREHGLTRQKAGYCHGLATRVLDGRLDLAAVAAAPDEVGRSMLLEVPGLGPWSVDVYYLMALRRPDVWPPGDLALAAALRDLKGLDALPTKDEQLRIAGTWTPWRSVAARILWMSYLDARGRYVPPSG